MKKLFIIFIALMGTLSLTFAQEEDAPVVEDTGLRPARGDWGVGFKISGLANIGIGEFSTDDFGQPQLLLTKYLSSKMAFRTTLGVNFVSGETTDNVSYISLTTLPNPALIDSTVKTTTSAMSVSLAPGIEKHLASANAKLDPYIGAVVPIGYMGDRTIETDRDYTITDQGDQKVDFKEDLRTNRVEAGGLSVGLNLLMGFNYFVAKNIALGAEYSLGFKMISRGGDGKETTTGTRQLSKDPANVLTIDRTNSFDNTTSVLNAGVSSLGFNLRVFW